jgi:hypothetical protein
MNDDRRPARRSIATAMPGGPGGLLPRGSHGSGRADFPHPARQATDSLRRGQTACTTRGRGSGNASSSLLVATSPGLALERRDNHLHHSSAAQYRNESSAE